MHADGASRGKTFGASDLRLPVLTGEDGKTETYVDVYDRR